MNLQKIKTQVISIIINRGLIAFFSLILEIVFIKYLTVEEKGEIFYIRNNIELFAYIFTFGLGFSIIHFRSKYGKKYDRQIRRWMLFSFLTLIISSIIFSNIDIVVKYLFIKKEYFFPAVIGSIFTLLLFFLQKIYLSDDNIKLHNQVIFYSKVLVSLVLIGTASFIEHDKIYFLLIGIPISLFMVTAFFGLRLNLDYHSKNIHNKFIKFSLNIYLYELIYQLKSKFDNFLILYFLGVSIVGVYSVAVNFGALVLIVSMSISLILLKEMSSVKNLKLNEVNSILIKYIQLITIITLLSIVLVYIAVHIYGQDKFEESIYIYMVYSINLLLFSIITFFQSYFGSINRTNIQLHSLLISLLPYISLFFIKIESIFELLVIVIVSNVLQCVYFYYQKGYMNVENI